MNATFRQLRLFLALAEHRSITAAARACHVTQPTVSMQLKELSEAVGMPLYEQIGRRLYLTEAGEALAETAQAMVEEWGSFEQRIDGMRGLTRGRLRLAVASTAQYFVPSLLGRFCASHPQIDIALELLNRDAVLARLRDNRDDLYILSMPPADLELETHAFLPNPLVVIASQSHPLAGRQGLTLADLAEQRFILRERGSGTRLACDAHFQQVGFVPQVWVELGSNEAIKQTVASEMGLSVISRHALAPIVEHEQLAVLDVQGFPLQSNWWTLYPRGKRLSPLATVFLTHLDDMAQAWYRQRQSQ
ncbi:LysR family transcriptional regulator [Metapseudomonas otitidis]|jgi:DNA-binding transcriptional LysR family regulator|uniref:LysR family transcriptional regulator n=1 Tax=Metapseudomonas otitidis TaxID=319939 RepID=A0A1I0SVA6_9GAMM|nr:MULTISPECIES: LysR family transcriptional regulator [Pseudomonas]KIV67486.1 RuBisCO operon transcriptional regulator [Pseudomonas sp. FeS53a]MBO2929732.1 LysR family transcriptional regulator [Pseudomonas otitidis]MCO7554751.1 LysR family transcriptional regulator [Pseudomonas otitidis]MCP1617425.1 DNA-binding transcriptional LysR family regulator [Pseudomonas otitidis]MDI6529130.1 LysR family transcriptional regulator [Pseudomonas otitidis]